MAKFYPEKFPGIVSSADSEVSSDFNRASGLGGINHNERTSTGGNETEIVTPAEKVPISTVIPKV